MKILAHRGYWNEQIQNNSPEALKKALDAGFGFESDLRDYHGELVISHNIADEKSQKAEDVFQWLREYHDQYCFAINIKADGLKEQLKQMLEKYQLENYFTFDMSVPQMIEYRDYGLRYFTRQSEVETELVLYEEAAGVWIDGFWDDLWISEELLCGHIQKGKTVCLVSPDLHKREYLEFWHRLKQYSIDFDRVMLCTDYPEEAKEYFKELV